MQHTESYQSAAFNAPEPIYYDEDPKVFYVREDLDDGWAHEFVFLAHPEKDGCDAEVTKIISLTVQAFNEQIAVIKNDAIDCDHKYSTLVSLVSQWEELEDECIA